MTEITPLDTAHAAMEAAPADDAARLGFYARLADGELFLLLTTEPAGDKIDPETFEIADGTFVLAFDREERLAQFVGRTAPYVAMPGRVLESPAISSNVSRYSPSPLRSIRTATKLPSDITT